MTARAATEPFAFKYRPGRCCQLKQKQRRLKPTRSFSAKQAYTEHTSIKGKTFYKRKYFVTASGNGCHHETESLKPVVEKSPYSAETGKPQRHFFNNKPHDENGNRLRSNVQYKAVKKVKAYYANPEVFEFIDIARKALKRKRGGGSKIGKHRSEGREALCCALEGLFLNVDVHSFRVGRPHATNNKLFHYATNAAIAAQCGLHPKRLQRSLELLEAAGVIKMKRQYEKLKNGEYVGKASAIWFTRAFMKAFGMLNAFNRTSQQLTKRRKQDSHRGIKSEEQVKAEANDQLCQAASQIVSKKKLTRSIKSLVEFIDVDDSPPEITH